MSHGNETDQIVHNVRRLANYIDIAYLKNDDEKFFELRSDFNLFINQIEFLYTSWFPKAKPVSDFDIINHLFKDIFKKDEKQYVKYSLNCLLKSAFRVFQTIEESHKDGRAEMFTANLRLLHEIAFETPIFLDTAFKIMENKLVDFGHGKRFKLEPRETLNASEQVLRRFPSKTLVGDFAISPASTFLIRQAIELWLQDIFGINSVWDDGVKKFIKLQPERLFSLLDNGGKNIRIPVPKAIIQKIHAWTQRYVHNGVMNPVWEVEHAQFVLRPLFYSENVLITTSFYDSIENKLQAILKNPHVRINRRKQFSSTVKDIHN